MQKQRENRFRLVQNHTLNLDLQITHFAGVCADHSGKRETINVKEIAIDGSELVILLVHSSVSISTARIKRLKMKVLESSQAGVPM